MLLPIVCNRVLDNGVEMANLIVSPSEWSSKLTGYYSVGLADYLFDVQSGRKDWSLSSKDNNSLRFEVRDGDAHWWDQAYNPTSERSEIATRSTINNGTPINIHYDFTLEQGSPNTAYFMILGQLHQNDVPGAPPWSPPFSIGMDGEKMNVTVAYTDESGNQVKVKVFADTQDIQRGHAYDIDIKTIMDPSGESGRLVVTRDGVTIADYSGPIGYKHQTSVYWAEGIYRHANATETAAAVYSDLKISTGATVSFPSKSDFIAAPTLTVDDVSAVNSAGTRQVTLTGSAKAGTTVLVLENGVVVGLGKADAAGHVTIAAAVNNSGTHELRSVAVGPNGVKGLTSTAMDVYVGTAQDIMGRMAQIAADKAVASILISDGKPLVVHSKSELTSLLKKTSVLDKIQGDYSFDVETTASGKNYNRQVEHYTSEGELTSRVRYAGSTVVYAERIDGTTTTVESWAADRSWSRTVIENGRTIGSANFNSAGTKTSEWFYTADGSKQSNYFDSNTKLKTRTVINEVDGDVTSITHGIKNKDYSSLATTINSSGVKTLVEAFDAKGKILSSENFLTGTYKAYLYEGANHALSGYKLIAADKSYTVVHYISGTQTVSDISYYDRAGNLIRTETMTPEQEHAHENPSHVEPTPTKPEGNSQPEIKPSPVPDSVPVPTDPFPRPIPTPDQATGKTTYQKDPISGLNIGKTVVMPDGSSVVTKFNAGHESQPASVTKIGADGKIETIQTFSAEGRLVAMEVQLANGTREFHLYDPVSGKETGFTIRTPGGERTEGTFLPSGKDYAQQVAQYDKNGMLTELTRYKTDGTTKVFHQVVTSDGVATSQFDGAGHLVATDIRFADGRRELDKFDASERLVRSEVYEKDGSRAFHDFDPNSGKETAYVLRSADGSRTEANLNVIGQSYGQQIAAYDSAGKLVEMTRLLSDGKTVVLHEIRSAGGGGEVHQFDQLGRETTATYTNAIGGKETYAYSYSGNSLYPSSSQHTVFDASGVKLLTDVENADGSHVQMSHAAGAVFQSHAGVSDTFQANAKFSDKITIGEHNGHDVVTGFVAKGASIGLADVIVIDREHANNFEELKGQIVSSGNDTLIKFSESDSLLLKGVASSLLTEQHFQFADTVMLHA